MTLGKHSFISSLHLAAALRNNGHSWRYYNNHNIVKLSLKGPFNNHAFPCSEHKNLPLWAMLVRRNTSRWGRWGTSLQVTTGWKKQSLHLTSDYLATKLWHRKKTKKSCGFLVDFPLLQLYCMFAFCQLKLFFACKSVINMLFSFLEFDQKFYSNFKIKFLTDVWKFCTQIAQIFSKFVKSMLANCTNFSQILIFLPIYPLLADKE